MTNKNNQIEWQNRNNQIETNKEKRTKRKEQKITKSRCAGSMDRSSKSFITDGFYMRKSNFDFPTCNMLHVGLCENEFMIGLPGSTVSDEN
jgi:hypothetical protein